MLYKDRLFNTSPLRCFLLSLILFCLFTTLLNVNHNPGKNGKIGEIYNADALFTIPPVAMESLVYSRPGRIELLPAYVHLLYFEDPG